MKLATEVSHMIPWITSEKLISVVPSTISHLKTVALSFMLPTATVTPCMPSHPKHSHRHAVFRMCDKNCTKVQKHNVF